MVKWMVALGTALIIAYAVAGVLLMIRWELEAASGRPLDDTVAALESAGQPYSTAPGIIFGTFGFVLAFAWAAATLIPALRFSGWLSAAVWGVIVALGAPAYFAASFGNMNSVGDAFVEWNAAAAFGVVVPLYLVSGIGAVVAILGAIGAVSGWIHRGIRARERYDGTQPQPG